MTVRLRRQLIDSLLTLLIPTLWLALLIPDPGGIPFWRGASYSDLLISQCFLPPAVYFQVESDSVMESNYSWRRSIRCGSALWSLVSPELVDTGDTNQSGVQSAFLAPSGMGRLGHQASDEVGGSGIGRRLDCGSGFQRHA